MVTLGIRKPSFLKEILMSEGEECFFTVVVMVTLTVLQINVMKIGNDIKEIKAKI